ncbi:MAG: MFS transporter [Sphingobium sp.]|nr:MAG: MFS transporter [Sphingobium sp.]
MTTATYDASSDRALMTRIMWRIMPLAIACLVVSTIDRTNIGFAKLGMLDDLGFSEAIFGFGSSLFYVGYVLFEIPSAIANYRYGARLWFARIMITWSIATLLLAFTRSAEIFYLLRFLLGVAEAGLYPALIFYLTLWFPEKERARAMGVLTLGSAFGNGLSALISGSLLDLDGHLGINGWQWVFLVTGVLPIVTTVLVLRYLPDRPQSARFLNAEEKDQVAALLGPAQGGAHRAHGIRVLFDWRVIGFGMLYGVFLGSLYGVNYWMPTVLRDFGVSGAANGAMIGIPWAVDAVLLMLIMPRLKSSGSVLWALLLLSLVAIVSFGAAASWGGLMLKVSALLFGIPAISLCIACFWTIPVRYFSGAHAAAAIGAISMVGNLGGVATLNLMPAIGTHLGSPALALWVPSIGMLSIALWSAWLIARERSVQVQAI